jgi:hypothetical protein
VSNYYRNVFTAPLDNSFTLDEARLDGISQVSEEENSLPFLEDEVGEAIFQMKHYKASGPDVFPAEFYQACWYIIKDDLMSMFVEFHAGKLPLYSLNFGTIILPLKCREATHINNIGLYVY